MKGATKILIIGNGFGGVYTLKNLHKYFCSQDDVKISMIGSTNYFLFTPLLHEVATGGINAENIVEPIHKVLGCCIDRFYLGEAKNINLSQKTVEINQENISYDYLVIATGASTNFYNIPGAEQYALTLKSLEDARKIKNKCIVSLEHASHIKDRAERKKMLAFTVVGGGPTGVELIAELEEFFKDTFSHYYAPEVIEDISLTLIQAGPELLPQFGKKLRYKSLEVLKKKGIKVMLNAEVSEVREKEVLLKDGTLAASSLTIWVAGIKPMELNWQGEAPKSNNGRLEVNESLELVNNPGVFALGDTALLIDKNTGKPVPQLAQAAVKEAKMVAKNINLAIRNQKMEAFEYESSGNLVSVGQWEAVGEILGLSISGPAVWWVWRTVYLFKLISLSKKVKVALDWTINLFYPRDISEL